MQILDFAAARVCVCSNATIYADAAFTGFSVE